MSCDSRQGLKYKIMIRINVGISNRSYANTHIANWIWNIVAFGEGVGLVIENRSRGYKTIIMLSSAEIKIYPAHKC